MELTEELLALLRENGAVLAAAGDMRGVENCAYPAGVAVAIPMPRDVVRSLPDAPSREYLAAYPEIRFFKSAAIRRSRSLSRASKRTPTGVPPCRTRPWRRAPGWAGSGKTACS